MSPACRAADSSCSSHFVCKCAGVPIETLLEAGLEGAKRKLRGSSQGPSQPRRITPQMWETSAEPQPAAPQPGGAFQFPADTVVCGRLIAEWLRRRQGQRGQCPHDALTVFEACYPSPADGPPPCLSYSYGTFVGHEWGGFLTFIPNPRGPHRLAVEAVRRDPWLAWLSETLMLNVPRERRVQSSSFWL